MSIAILLVMKSFNTPLAIIISISLIIDLSKDPLSNFMETAMESGRNGCAAAVLCSGSK
tara:strand:- start:215 stop:391 length:177 start_codon:yes stop_codon:yes gene_type:complete